MKKIRIHWCYNDNFGDALNPYIIGKLSGLRLKYCNYTYPKYYNEFKIFIKSIINGKKYDFDRLSWPDKKNPVVLGIGSLLNRSNLNYLIWGSGYMNHNEKARGGKLYAVRGMYSAEKLYREGFPYCNIWGDPAVLLPLVYPQVNCSNNQLDEIGIIPHSKDYNYFKNNYGSKAAIVDIRTSNIENTVDKICRNRFILSTSLHGLIVAHAYNIPAIWIQYNDIDTDGIKFHDYFSSVGISIYEGFKNYQDIFDNPIQFFNKYQKISLPQLTIKSIQANLINVSPFPILDKYKNLVTK